MAKAKWNLEEVRKVASGKTAKQLHKEFRGAYNWAKRNDQMDNISLVTKDNKYTVEKVKFYAEGLKPSVFREHHRDMHNWAKRTGNLENIGLKPSREPRWTIEAVKGLAAGMRSGEFKADFKSAYDWAQKNGVLGQLGLDNHKHSRMNKWGRELAVDMGLTHSTEYANPSCRDKSVLRFDLVIWGNGGRGLRCLVEFQGKQHYEAIEFFGGEGKLAIQQRRDQIKRDWCAEQGIPLIEISYKFKDKGEQAFKDELRRQLRVHGIA